MTILSTRRRQAEPDVPDLRTSSTHRPAAAYLRASDRDRQLWFDDIDPDRTPDPDDDDFEDEPVAPVRRDGTPFVLDASRKALDYLTHGEPRRTSRPAIVRMELPVAYRMNVLGEPNPASVGERLAACGLVYAKRGTAVTL